MHHRMTFQHEHLPVCIRLGKYLSDVKKYVSKRITLFLASQCYFMTTLSSTFSRPTGCNSECYNRKGMKLQSAIQSTQQYVHKLDNRESTYTITSSLQYTQQIRQYTT